MMPRVNRFSDLSLSKPGIYHYRVTEVPGNDEGVVYDKLEANITIQVVRENCGQSSQIGCQGCLSRRHYL